MIRNDDSGSGLDGHWLALLPFAPLKARITA